MDGTTVYNLLKFLIMNKNKVLVFFSFPVLGTELIFVGV